MKRDYPYKEFRDLILEQLQDIQELDTETAVEDLVRLAESNGLSLGDLIGMAQSGMSGADIYRAIHRASLPPLFRHNEDREGGSMKGKSTWKPVGLSAKRFIDVFCDRTAMVLSEHMQGVGCVGSQSSLGRALGRVLAHEFYHVVARTDAHGK